MKKLILLIVMVFFAFISKGQSEYPKYMMDNGRTVVVLTIEQAQKLDNDLEILELYKKLQINADSMNVSYLSVIDEYGKQVAILNLKVSTLQDINKEQSTLVTNLKEQITNYKSDIEKANTQIKNGETIIKNQKKEIRKQKIQKFVGWGVGLAAIVAVVILAL